jgi:hypothetical protein
LQVNIKIYAVDVPADLSDFTIDMPEGSDIEAVLDYSLKVQKLNIEPDYFKASMVLLNNHRSEIDTVVNDGDIITILRTLEGG